jgi:hypothetical protein
VTALLRNREELQELWERVKEKLTKDDLNKKLLLVTDSDGRTAWHKAEELYRTEVLEILWEWAKGELTPDDLHKKFCC